MESSTRLILSQPTFRAASLLCRPHCHSHTFPSAPAMMRRQCARLFSTTGPRHAEKPERNPTISSWFQPKAGAEAKKATTAPPPLKMANSPSTAPGSHYSGTIKAWSTIMGADKLMPPSKQRQAEAAKSSLTDDISLNISDILNNRGQSGIQDAAKFEQRIRPFFRRKPETGKLIQIKPGKIDLANALTRLSVRVGMNRINHQLNLQREHERPGLRRKRLRSERWKRQFSEAFKYTVKRANELSKMGW